MIVEDVEMGIHNELDEHLEVLYHLQERHMLELGELQAHMPDYSERALEELVQQDKIVLEGASIHLTEAGFRKAEQIVRQHRLAERLLADVLHMSADEVERGACEFEHIIAAEITESICVLLGHPRTCPHGSPIPEGPCCRAYARQCTSVVVPLPEMPLGVTSRIAFVNTARDGRQYRLAQLGVVPGTSIKLHQRKPSIVAILGESRLAMEPSVARDILVWKAWSADSPAPAEPAKEVRRWFRSGRGVR